MTDICGQVEAATKDLKPGSKPEAAAPLLEVLATFNQSHIAGSDLQKNATGIAQNMQGRGVFGEAAETGIHGSTGWVQQQHGKPNYLELIEGDRTETLRLDDDGAPMLNTVIQKCGDKLVRSAYFHNQDGGRRLSSISVLPDVEILMDRDGQKPYRIQSPF